MTAAVQPVTGELGKVIRGVRARWRAKVALRGAVLVAALGLVILIVASALLEQQGFTERSLSIVRAVSYGLLAASGAMWMILPLLRKTADERLALYVEERASTLDAALVTAVEQASRGNRGSPLRDALVESAVKKARTALSATPIERSEIARTTAALLGAIACGIGLVVLGPLEVRRTARFLFMPWGTTATVTPYAIAVTPGDTTLARGADQEIVARLVGFDAPDVVLAVRRGEASTPSGTAGDWERVAMELRPVGTDSAQRTFRLFDLTEATMYYVESGSVRSPVFTITVADLPYVARIDHEFVYPAYTGLPSERVEDAGDIAALKGTRVRITATPTLPVARGRIIVEGESPIPLVSDSSGALSGVLSVRRQSFYRIELEAAGGAMIRGSLDHTIDVLADERPSVELSTPGRDTKVSPLEEAFVEARATDDYGVRSLDLVYTVNGGEERTITLRAANARAAKETSAGHTFFLEELNLQPGDVVSYYARTADGNTASGPGRAESDIYFMEVRPFAREYRQADQQGGGGGGGGGGGESPAALSARQREIVAATFKALRDREQTGAAETRENLATLALAQGKLRERVEILQRRMRERGVLGADSSFAAIAAELPAAAAAMRTAEERLAAREPREALSPEQQALQHLLRAEAAFREVEVSFGGNEGGGGGGGESPNAEDLADLFELENDKLRNQYESVERSSREQQDSEVDEIMEKLKQLAARQQQENERMRQRAQSMSGRGGSGGASQRAMAEEAEELARRLERLSRQNPEPELNESARRLREAANEMRRSATQDGARAAGGGGRAASERLENARRSLGEGRDSRLDRDIREALESAEALASEQREVAKEAAALPAARGGGGGDDRDARQARLRDRKDRMAEQTTALEGKLDRIGREGARERPEAATASRDAARAIRESRLRDKILYSKGLLGPGTEEYSRNFESGISEDLDAVRDRVAKASRAAATRPSRAKEQTLERAQDLVRGLESLRDRTATAGQGAQPGEGGAADARGGGGGAPGAGQQSGGGAAGRGTGGRMDPERARQFRPEFRRQRLLADSIRRELGRQGVDVGDLDRLIERMRALEGARIYDDRAELERLQAAVLEGLKAYEFALRRELEGGERNRPLLGGTSEVPAKFRALVEEYYRSLSRGAPPLR
ncbi:MAG: DUF4175 family protein [Gemmatimonadaceae bacterium]